MVLVTGPTGSGKTTTLYSALSELNKSDENISTAEDPVEFNLAGINQVQMHEDIGLNFAAALRSFLRQDPDIIMVGEIRDFETAEIASRPRSRATWCCRRCTPTTRRRRSRAC
jgi:type IV pilus assembly protein PilB